MQARVEKPLLEIAEKSMLEWVLTALKRSKSIDEIIVAVSPATPQTAHAARKLGARLAETPGHGYGADMKHAISKLKLGDTLVVSADLPFLKSEISDRAIKEYWKSRKPSLSVMIPLEICEKIGSKPQYFFEIEGKNLVPIGLNIINGHRIREPELDQAIMIVDCMELAINVNSPLDYELAKEWFEKHGRTTVNA